MIKSMTGYGRAQDVADGRDITVEIKAVNHRFFECSCRAPRIYGFLDERIKSYLQGQIARGKVEVSVTIYNVAQSDVAVDVDGELAQSYVDALRKLSAPLRLADDLALSSLSRFGDIFIVRKETPDEDKIWASVRQVFQKALDGFLSMRTLEGSRLREDIQSRIQTLLSLVSLIEQRSPRTVEAYRERLTVKLKEILEDRNFDEARLITEAAIFADKIDVSEETVRLRSHLDQLSQLISQDNAVGRKLDFIVQEINREINTIGSKAQDIEIGRLVVDAKAEAEKIREQVQNIE